jgi:replication factor C subunit 1
MAKRSAGPSAPGSKEIPVGQPNCLAGLTFVFTGELDSLSREEASDLAKRYGGYVRCPILLLTTTLKMRRRVTGAPSRVTSYVVLGTGAGPKKLETIQKQNLKTLNEDQFLELIGKR